MNRAERRRLAKLSPDKLNIIQNVERLNGINFATSGIFAALVLTLHDKWEWHQGEIKLLLEQVSEQFDSINEGYLSLEDVKRTVLEEVGIDIR